MEEMLKLILAEVKDVSRKVDHLEIRIEKLETRFDKFVEETNERFNKLETRFDQFEKETNNRFNQLETRFEGLETRFEGLETRFEGLETRFEGLETRFEGLETRFDAIETRFDGLETKVDGLAERVGHLEGDSQSLLIQLGEHFANVYKRFDENDKKDEARFEKVYGHFAKMDKRFDRLELGQERILNELRSTTTHLEKSLKETRVVIDFMQRAEGRGYEVKERNEDEE